MLTFAFILAICSAGLEIIIAQKIPTYRKLASKYLLVNLAGSVALSWTIGALFGATGLIAMTAGVMSTILALPYYKSMEYVDNNPEKIAKVNKNVQAIKDFGGILMKIVMLITLPVRAWRAVVMTIKGT